MAEKKPSAEQRTVGMFFTPTASFEGEMPVTRVEPGGVAQVTALERIAEAAASFRTSTAAAIAKLRPRAEQDYDRAAFKLDGALTELARLRGETAWPKPQEPKRVTAAVVPGAFVLFIVKKARVVGYVDSITEEGITAVCTGVVVSPTAGRQIPPSVRWRIPVGELVVLHADENA